MVVPDGWVGFWICRQKIWLFQPGATRLRCDKEKNKLSVCVSHYLAMSVRTYSICTATCQKVLPGRWKMFSKSAKRSKHATKITKKKKCILDPFSFFVFLGDRFGSFPFCFGMLLLLCPLSAACCCFWSFWRCQKVCQRCRIEYQRTEWWTNWATPAWDWAKAAPGWGWVMGHWVWLLYRPLTPFVLSTVDKWSMRPNAF